jgi:hypothetical protein
MPESNPGGSRPDDRIFLKWALYALPMSLQGKITDRGRLEKMSGAEKQAKAGGF